jgi:hypothetical protein
LLNLDVLIAALIVEAKSRTELVVQQVNSQTKQTAYLL